MLKRFLGNYMPFAGVRYYCLADQLAINEGGNKIGAVGWRLGRTSVVTVAKGTDRTIPERTGLKSEMLRNTGIFRNFDDGQIKRIVDAGQVVNIREGDFPTEVGQLISHLQ